MKLFGKKEIEKKNMNPLNQISQYGLVKPNYKQDLNSQRVIEFAYLPEEEKVILIGSMSGYYPYWISESDIFDAETNTAILESILHDEFSSFTEMNGKIYQKLRDTYRRRIVIAGDDVRTSFDHGYAKEQPQYWSRFIAGDISSYYQRLKNLCRERELSGKYLEFLKAYLKELETKTSSDPVRDYENKKTLMDLIRSEDYLYLSENKEIRDTYIRIRYIMTDLYNTYMSIVR